MRRATISFVISVCPNETARLSQWMKFYDIRRLMIFRKSVEKIQVSLQSDKNNGHFIQRHVYIYDTSLTASLNKTFLRQ